MVAIWLRFGVFLIAVVALGRSMWVFHVDEPEAAIRWLAVALVLVLVSWPRRRRRPQPTAPHAAGLAKSHRVIE